MISWHYNNWKREEVICFTLYETEFYNFCKIVCFDASNSFTFRLVLIIIFNDYSQKQKKANFFVLSKFLKAWHQIWRWQIFKFWSVFVQQTDHTVEWLYCAKECFSFVKFCCFCIEIFLLIGLASQKFCFPFFSVIVFRIIFSQTSILCYCLGFQIIFYYCRC